MKITAQLADGLAELKRLHEARRHSPHDPEINHSYYELRLRIPRPLLSIFDLRRRIGRRPFAPLIEELCGGCLSRQSLKAQLDLKAGTRIVRCSACGVVLFDPTLAEEPSDLVS